MNLPTRMTQGKNTKKKTILSRGGRGHAELQVGKEAWTETTDREESAISTWQKVRALKKKGRFRPKTEKKGVSVGGMY